MVSISIYDELQPEDMAMLQALYSRSQKSVKEHIEKVKETGSGQFCKRFYVGFGHQSIGDCGTTTVFIENVSMLAAKAIQDSPMYSGQESSTRYIDYSKQPIISPLPGTDGIQKKWVNFYLDNMQALKEYLTDIFPRKEGEKKVIYRKAIEARAFDIMRGFLPAGMTTQLSWHTNLRQASDKIIATRHHPLEEVRNIISEIHSGLKEKYANSFGHKLYPKTESYNDYLCERYTYSNPSIDNNMYFSTDIKWDDIKEEIETFTKRPIKTLLPNWLAKYGMCRFKFLIDYGSFRDLQRHRNGVCEMPLLTFDHGFNNWYLDQLPSQLRSMAEDLIQSQIEEIVRLGTEPETMQYYVAMGFNVVAQVAYGLPATAYVIELRSGKHVHPTLRAKTQEMHHKMIQEFPELILHTDLDPDQWDTRRGEQDIVPREQL